MLYLLYFLGKRLRRTTQLKVTFQIQQRAKMDRIRKGYSELFYKESYSINTLNLNILV